MKADEIEPKAGPTRHIVDPPSNNNNNNSGDDNSNASQVSLVCCQTTAGPLSIAVHPSWAPLGAQRFLAMVRDDYFSSQVPFMRCLTKMLCQFGIAGDPKVNVKYKRKNMQDDPQWLPEGKVNRKNKLNVKRFSKGYLA